MNRRIWTGVVAGVLAAAVLLTVGIGAYRAGQDDELVTRVVSEGEPGRSGEVVRVVGDHHGWGPGPGPFFFLFPLLVIGLIVLLVRRGSRPGWGHGWGHGGPGWHRPYGPGDRSGWFDEWHRRAHEEAEANPSDDRPAPPSGA